MGDILIHGMEMPNDGHWGTVSIPFYIHGNGSVSDSKGHIIGNAVYVPPHGRLIDADAVSLDGGPYEYDEWCKWALEQYQDAPTIIPADKAVPIPPKSKEQQDLEDLVERLNRVGIAP